MATKLEEWEWQSAGAQCLHPPQESRGTPVMAGSWPDGYARPEPGPILLIFYIDRISTERACCGPV